MTLDPDPLTVDEEPVPRPSTYSNPGMVILWIATALATFAMAALIGLAVWVSS